MRCGRSRMASPFFLFLQVLIFPAEHLQHSYIIKYNDDRSHTDRSPNDDIYTRSWHSPGEFIIHHTSKSESIEANRVVPLLLPRMAKGERRTKKQKNKTIEKPTTLKMINYSRIKWIGNTINKNSSVLVFCTGQACLKSHADLWHFGPAEANVVCGRTFIYHF